MLLGLVACEAEPPPGPDAPWQERAALPERRLEAAAAMNGTRLVVAGGFATGAADVPPLEISRAVLQYDPFGDADTAWTRLPDAQVAWTHAALVGVGGALYLLGGLEGDTFVPSGRVFRLGLGDEAWSEKEMATMPAGEERGAAAVVHTQGHVFLFGGEGPAGPLATVLDYVIADDVWKQELPPLPTPRSHAAVMRDGDGTFIVAGGIGVQGPLGDVWALPPGGTWIAREPMPTPRGGCAYGTVYGRLVCAGGETLVNGVIVPSRAVEVYDPNVDTWTQIAEIPDARGGAAGAVVANRLYVVGGSASAALEPTATVFELDVLDTIEP